MVIRSNMNSMNASRNLSMNNNMVAKSLEKLASGYAINSAADDASGLIAVERMRSQITGIDQGTNNALEGVGLLQTAEGALSEVHDMLDRMVELTTKAANGTISDEIDREAIQCEIDVLISEIDRIVLSTNYNGIFPLDGSLGDGAFYIRTSPDTVYMPGYGFGSNSSSSYKEFTSANNRIDNNGNWGNNEVSSVDFSGLSSQDLIGGSMTFDYTNVYSSTRSDTTTITVKFVESITDVPSGEIAIQYDGQQTFGTLGKDEVTLYMVINPDLASAADSLLSFSVDVGSYHDDQTIYFDATTPNSKSNSYYDDVSQGYNINKKDTTGVASTGSITNMTLIVNETFYNSENGGYVDGEWVTMYAGEWGYGEDLELHVCDANETYNKVYITIDSMRVDDLGIWLLDVSTEEKAGASMNIVRDAINIVSDTRAGIGAIQNRLEKTMSVNNNSSENITAAKSAIKDCDMAKEMIQYTKMNVLTQSAQAMLAQTNQAPQQVLSLLGQ